MPQLDPSSSHIARAPITVKPAGLIGTAELYLVRNATKVTSSGEVSFTSTGGAQSVSFPITMPAVEGTYKVYIDVFSAGELIGAFVAREDVVVATPIAGFSYGTPTARLVSPHPYYPTRDEAGRLIFNVLVTNPRGAQTRQLTIKYNVPRYDIWGRGHRPTFDFSLAAGETRTFIYDDPDSIFATIYRLYDEYGKIPHIFWIEDDAGGKSAECTW